MKKQNYAKINEWKHAKTDRIQILPRKDLRMPERLQMAVDKTGANSRQAYIIDAINRKLDADGIPILPPIED